MAWELMMKSVSRETDEASSIIDDERKKAPESISLRDTLVEQLSRGLVRLHALIFIGRRVT